MEALNPGETVHIDLINQLYHICSYLIGNLVFISIDGFLRDASEFHGKEINQKIIIRSVNLFRLYMIENSKGPVIFYVDKQVSQCEFILDEFKKSKTIQGHDVKYIVTEHVDQKIRMSEEGLAATSDSQIIDKLKIKVIDLAREILHFHFQPDFVDLKNVLFKN